MNFLLLDFGASRIKSVIYNAKLKKFSSIYSTNGPFIIGKDIIKLSFFSNSFQDHLKFHSAQNNKIDAINMCCEMHGFVLVGEDRNIYDEYYVSWRSINNNFLKKDLFNFFPDNDFKDITGMNFRDGLPVTNVSMYTDKNRKYRFMGICESLALIHGNWHGKISKSIAASSGLFDISKKNWINSLTIFPNVKFPEVCEEKDNIYGDIKIENKNVPIYGCIGDLQASYFSIEMNDKSININLGTGSQVSKKYFEGDEKLFEIRPMFNEDYFTTVSHIPCGRVLDIYSNFFNKIANVSNGNKDIFWDMFFSKSVTNKKNLLNIDLSIFKGSYNYKSGGLISNIREDNMDPEVFVDSIKHSFVAQYLKVIKDMQDHSEIKFDNIILTGALASKISNFCELLSSQLKIKTKIVKHDYDATLIGLSKLSESIYNNLD